MKRRWKPLKEDQSLIPNVRAKKWTYATPKKKSKMKLFPLFLLFAVTFFVGPLLMEGNSDECSALASRLLELNSKGADQNAGNVFVYALTSDLVKEFGGKVVEEKIIRKYPSLPPPVGCSFFYWKTLFDPSLISSN